MAEPCGCPSCEREESRPEGAPEEERMRELLEEDIGWPLDGSVEHLLAEWKNRGEAIERVRALCPHRGSIVFAADVLDALSGKDDRG